MIDFTAAAIAALAGLIMSLIFAYLPVVREWYYGLDVDKRALMNLGLGVVVAGILFGLSFVPNIGLFSGPLTWQELLSVALALILTNKPVTSFLPLPRSVRRIIRIRQENF